MRPSAPPLRFLKPEELKSSRVFFEMTLPRAFPWFLYGVVLFLLAGTAWVGFGEMAVIVKGSVLLRSQQNSSELKSSQTGLVVRKQFVNGQKVKAGELLWSLDDRNAQTQRVAAEQQKLRDEALLEEALLVGAVLNGQPATLLSQNPGAERKWALIQREDRRLALLAGQAQREWQLEKDLPVASQTRVQLKNLETSAQMASGNWEAYSLSEKQKNADQINSLRTEIENLTSQLAALDQQIAASRVVAPLDGWVEEVQKINPGDVIVAGATLVRVIPLSARQLKAELTVSSADIAEIRPGMVFRMIFPKLPPSEFGELEGRIVTVPQDSWLQANSLPVYQLEGSLPRFWMKNNEGLQIDLKAGMTAEARIILKQKPIWRFLLEKLDFLK